MALRSIKSRQRWVLPLIHEILGKEQDLIGDERDKILWYTGCAELIE
jgi:hypothetical protein